MKKRLFDCDKWKDPWYRKLPPIFKLFWNYLLDNCECWGEWKPDSELTSFLLGTEIDLQEALKNFNTSDKQRVQVFPNGNWFLLDFNYFQYGELSESCNAHKPVINSLKKLENKGYLKGTQRVQNQNQNQNKDKDKEKKKKLLEFILLTDEQINRLQSLLGKVTYHEYTQKLNDYIGSKGKSYKSHYHTILTWARKDGKIDPLKGTVNKPDPECGVCSGKGYLLAQFNGQKNPCSCLSRS